MRKIYAGILTSIVALLATAAVAAACPSGTYACWACANDGCTAVFRACCAPGGPG